MFQGTALIEEKLRARNLFFFFFEEAYKVKGCFLG